MEQNQTDHIQELIFDKDAMVFSGERVSFKKYCWNDI